MTDVSAGASAGLRALFAPGSVAVVGASSDPTRIGGRPINYALAAGFKGRLYPVNPNRAAIQGLPAYPRLSAIDADIDLAIIAVPAAGVADCLQEAVDRGVKAAIIFSAGFAEIGPEGRQRQEHVGAICRAAGVRVLGPNCLGLVNAAVRHTATFASFLQGCALDDGPIAIVSQSGAYASYLFMLAAKRAIRIGRWVTTGNEMDVGLAEAIDYLIDDPGVLAIGCVAEGIRNGRELLRALERAARAGKPVILLKMGRSAQGALAAQSHTAALAVDDDLLEAVVRQAGGLRVATTEQMLDVLYGLQRHRPLAGNRVGILTVSGGAGVLMADAAATFGLAVPALAAAAQDRLKQALPHASTANPVDVTAQVLNDVSLMTLPLRAMLEDGEYDAVAVFLMNYLSAASTAAGLRQALESALIHRGERALALVGTGEGPHLRELERRGLLLFEDPERAMATLGAMARIGALLRRRPFAAPSLQNIPRVRGDECNEVSAKAILNRLGLRAPREKLVMDAAAAGSIAAAIGAPVALKVVSADIAHKSDVGGVRLGLMGERAVEGAATEMLAAVKRQRPDARIDGLLVSEMVSKGVEMIVATHVDRLFGPIVMVGFGGVSVEATRDVAFRYGEVSAEEARGMIDGLRGRRLLDGFRGGAPADIDALAEAIVLMSRFGAANEERLRSAEVNPLAVGPKGSGCWMLDALMTFTGAADRSAETAC